MSTGLYAIAALTLSLWAVLQLILQKREPASTLAWLLFVIFVPFGGPLVFFAFGPQRLERSASKRRARIFSSDSRIDRTHSEQHQIASAEVELPYPDRDVFRLAGRISEFPPTCANDVDLVADPRETLDRMTRAIATARHRIHLEYYIVANDEVTEELFAALIEASRRGVKVRLLYDSLGSLSLKRLFLRRLTKSGVETAAFLPFSLTNLFQRINPNFRNHRKLMIVDGALAFTGGVNIGREYLGRRTKDQWRDFAVVVRGACCEQLDEVFRQDWEFTTQRTIEPLPKSSAVEALGPGEWVQVLESGPDSSFRTLHQTLFLGVTSATEEILLTTPYFVPDTSIATALSVAALKGVRVKLLLPSKTDVPLVRAAGRSFYQSLLQAGVEIYEYQPAILHSKLLIVDRRWAIVGSANMDIRSFRLNFELNLLVHGRHFIEQVCGMFEADLSRSKPVPYPTFLKRPILEQLGENAARLLSPWL